MKKFSLALLAAFAIGRGAVAEDDWFAVNNPNDPNATVANTSLVDAIAETPMPNACSCNLCEQDTAWFSQFRSDHEFDDFISPVTNPVWFEDPRSLTQVRGLFINQQFPKGSALGRGDVQVYGLQAWLALSDRLSIVAPKDGYVSLQPEGSPHRDGWADIATGFKYVLVRDPCNQFLVSTGVIYEWTNGSSSVFQGNGNGVWNFFLSTAKGWGNTHFMGTAGWHLPNDGSAESQSIFLSLHLDQKLTDKFYALVEMNGIQYVDNGKALPVSFEGGDIINLGATQVSGNTVVTTAVGGAYKFSESLIFSAAWEFPISNREDLLSDRVTATVTLRY